ncbi:MAG TPA: glycosyltransferase [Candidatus Nanopelagicales bacterium]|nr:glycosyltransferase [Candidatus Nanopelagicales bacterium]
MTRVLVCANNIDELGGAQRVVHVLADGLQRREHQVTAVGITPYKPAHSMPGDFERRVLMPEVWPKKSPQTERTRANLRKTAVAQMLELVRSIGDEPGVIITAQVWSMEIVADALAMLTPQVRERWKVIGQYHGSFAAAASGRDLARIVRSYREASVFTALSYEDGAAFTRAGLRNVRSMANPLAFWPPEPARRPGPERVLTYLGRLSPEKGVDLLIDAWSLLADRYPQWRLRIVGDGPLATELREQAAMLAGAERIDWQDPTSDPASVLLDSDLVAVPSRTEGLPLVVAEAQACGVAVVATDCSSGVRQLIGTWGRLAPREDSRALAGVLDAAMGDEQWRMDSGKRARQEMERYRLDAVLDSWEQLIARVLL